MTGIKSYISRLNQETSALPLTIFRMAFGALMAISQIRFLWKGWVEELYLSPDFHFTFPSFHWVQVLPEFWMYSLVVLTIGLSVMIAFGLFYRVGAILFCLAFTYLELIDMSLYLNHYYFISLISLLLIFLPAHSMYSLDNRLGLKKIKTSISAISIEIIKWQLTLVYFFAGIAKIKTDWLFNAQPMKIWLSARADFPVVGFLFGQEWMAYAFSWSGMIYDCTIPFFLFYKKTRPFAFIAVVFFHVMTWLLFNIGMFPWIMIACSLIFFETDDWKKVASFFGFKWTIKNDSDFSNTNHSPALITQWALGIYFFIQIVLPLRQHFYPNNPLWTELGYRFSWNVMLAEKTGYCHFIITDKEKNATLTVDPSQHLTPLQVKQMSFQPDMIWQFAHHLKKEFAAQGQSNLSISAYNKVSLNGRESQFLIDPRVDLLRIESVLDLQNAILPEFSKQSEK